MINIIPIDEGESLLKILVYGEFGSGKTMFAGTAADHKDLRPVLFITCEGGELTVRGKDMMKTDRIFEIKQFQEVLDGLTHRHPKYAEFRTVVVDSITAVRDMMLEEMLAKPNRKLDVPTIQEWGLVNTNIKRLVRHFVHLPLHVIFTCLPRFYYPKSKDENPAVEPIEVTPDFSRKLSNSVCAMVDHVWYLYVDPTKADPEHRSLLTRPTNVYAAKTRGEHFSAAIGQQVSNPSIAELYTTLISVGCK